MLLGIWINPPTIPITPTTPELLSPAETPSHAITNPLQPLTAYGTAEGRKQPLLTSLEGITPVHEHIRHTISAKPYTIIH